MMIGACAARPGGPRRIGSPGRPAQPSDLAGQLKAMTNARMTSDSVSARPMIIGVKILPEAWGLRAMPSSAERGRAALTEAAAQRGQADRQAGPDGEPQLASCHRRRRRPLGRKRRRC